MAWLPFVFLTACSALQQVPDSKTKSPVSPVAPDTEIRKIAADHAPTIPVPEAINTATTEKIARLRSWVDLQNRLDAVAGALLIKNAHLCPKNTYNLLGITAKTQYSYSTTFIAAAQSGLGLDERLRVLNILPGSGAARVDLVHGDTLVAVDDKPLPQGPGAEKKAGAMVSTATRKRSSVKLTVLRDGARLHINVPLTPACAYSVELGDSDSVNSYADGRRIMITRGMLNFAKTDDELAFLVAKEVAHNMLMRSPRPFMRVTIDNLRMPSEDPVHAPRPAKLTPYSASEDAAADKVSLYLLTSAGYSIENTVSFWKRMAAQYPQSIQNGHTSLHPSTNDRLSMMDLTVKTIQFKKQNDEPLFSGAQSKFTTGRAVPILKTQ